MKRDRILRAVWTYDPEHLALSETALLKVVSNDGDRVAELREREGASGWAINQRGLVGELAGAMHDERGQGNLGNLYVRIGTFDDHRVLGELVGLRLRQIP